MITMYVGLTTPSYPPLMSNHHIVDEEIAKTITEVVWNVPTNIRDSINIVKMAKSLEDIQ
jgi:hypothetical protein